MDLASSPNIRPYLAAMAFLALEWVHPGRRLTCRNRILPSPPPFLALAPMVPNCGGWKPQPEPIEMPELFKDGKSIGA